MAAIAEGLDVSGFQGQFDWAAAVNTAPGLAFGAYRLTSGLGAAEPDARWNSEQIREQRLYSAAFHLLDPKLDGGLQAQAFIAAHAKLGLSQTDMLWLDTERAGSSAAVTAACALAFMRELDHLVPSNPSGVFSFTDFMKYGFCAGLGDYPLWAAFPSARAPHDPIPWMNWSFWSWGVRDGSTPSIFNGTAAQLASWLGIKSAPVADDTPAAKPARASIVSNAQLLQQLQILNKKADVIMSQQDEINADVQTIEAGVAALGTAASAIQAEIASLQAANPALDLTGLNQAASDLTAAVAGVSAIAPPAAPPAG